MIAIGEERKAIQEAERRPAAEEVNLPQHLVQKWMEAAPVVTTMLNDSQE
jgi:hypothetical protein